MGIWVAELLISPRVAEKIAGLHGLSVDEVRDSVQCVSGLSFRWDVDEVRGRRALVSVTIRAVARTVVLYPVDDHAADVWALGSAYET